MVVRNIVVKNVDPSIGIKQQENVRHAQKHSIPKGERKRIVQANVGQVQSIRAIVGRMGSIIARNGKK